MMCFSHRDTLKFPMNDQVTDDAGLHDRIQQSVDINLSQSAAGVMPEQKRGQGCLGWRGHCPW